MNARDLLRSVRTAGSAQGRHAIRSAWRRERTDRRDLPRRGPERARVPGLALEAKPMPGGGIVRFARSSLRVRVAVGGAVFCGWDGAGPEPSYALAGERPGGGVCPAADTRAVLEPDKDGWRVVSERITVVISRHGAVEMRTPGGLLLRREQPPRWWGAPGEPEAVPSRWVQRSRTPADARVFGLGGRTVGPRLPAGAYRLWNAAPGGSAAPGGDRPRITMPVQLVVADAGCHLIFHDNTWSGRITLRDGEEGAGSGHDQQGGCEVRMDGGPLRYWVVAGTPARVLAGWTALTGRPALPPRWALGHHVRSAAGSGPDVRRVAAGYRDHGLPLTALHLDAGHLDGGRAFTADPARFPDLPHLAQELAAHEVRLVSVVEPAVKAEPGSAAYDEGRAADFFVRDARGGEVRGTARPGESVFPDFTDPRARAWWGGRYGERLERGFAGVWHDRDEPAWSAPFGDPTLPRSARHVLEGHGGDHREAHNVYGLSMARAGYRGLRRLRPGQRPFLLSGSGWAGLQRFGGAWSSDTADGWDGLRASLAQVLGLGLCGVPFSGPDAGAGGNPSPELYLRRLQMSAYLPFFRTGGSAGNGPGEPWEFGAEVLGHARAALAGRERLLPYLETLSHVARGAGAPYVRPLWWSSPGDRALRDCGDAFLLGDALLVAPVLEPGSPARAVRLPRGRWYDTATGRAHRGPGQVLLDAPLDRIPVLARAGSVIPLNGADGEPELEVWAPRRGRTGSGVVFTGDPEGWGPPMMERFVSRWVDGAVVVERDGGGAPGYRVRVRGADA